MTNTLYILVGFGALALVYATWAIHSLSRSYIQWTVMHTFRMAVRLRSVSDALEEQVDALEEQVDALEKHVDTLERHIDTLEKQLDRHDSKISNLLNE